MNTETTEKPSTELTLPARAAIALGTAEHEIKLRVLVMQSANIKTVTNIDGREEAHRAGMNLTNARVAITKTGKAAREDATKFSTAVIAEEKRLVALIAPEEDRIFALRDGFDAKVKQERDAAIAAERARCDAIKARIDEMRGFPLRIAGRSSTDISAAIYSMVNFKVGEDFEEFQAEAAQVRLDVLDQLAKAETVQRGIEIEAESQHQEAARLKLAQEEESARLKAERAELDRLNAEAESRRAEQARQDAIERAAIAAQAKAAKDAQEAAQAILAHDAEVIRQERAALDAEKAAAARIEQDRIDAIHAAEEREAIAQVQREHEAELVRRTATDSNNTIGDRLSALPIIGTLVSVGGPGSGRFAPEPFPFPTKNAAMVVTDSADIASPGPAALIEAVRCHFGVSDQTALQWLRDEAVNLHCFELGVDV